MRSLVRTRARGAAYVEVLVIVGVVVVLGLLAVTTLSKGSSEQAEKEAACIKSFECGSGAPGAGAGQDVASMVGTPGAVSGTASGVVQSKGFWGTTGDIASGFFVDGLWGTITGLGHAVIHPIDTVTGIGSAVVHPIATATAIKDGVVRAWNDNPERLVGAGLFEIITLPLAPAKAAKAEKIIKAAEIAEEAAAIAAKAEKLAAVEKVAAAEKAAEAARAAEVARAAEAARAGEAARAAEAAGAVARTAEEISAAARRASLWADEHWDAVQLLPPASVPGISYSGFSSSVLPSVMETGLRSGESLGRRAGPNSSFIWFKQGEPFYMEGMTAAVPTNRLEQLGGVHGVGLNGQRGVVTVPHSALPGGVPFSDVAIVIPAGNGYVIPVHIPPNWTGPAFPVPPGWKP